MSAREDQARGSSLFEICWNLSDTKIENGMRAASSAYVQIRCLELRIMLLAAAL
jgi:hypothetical protein